MLACICQGKEGNSQVHACMYRVTTTSASQILGALNSGGPMWSLHLHCPLYGPVPICHASKLKITKTKLLECSGKQSRYLNHSSYCMINLWETRVHSEYTLNKTTATQTQSLTNTGRFQGGPQRRGFHHTSGCRRDWVSGALQGCQSLMRLVHLYCCSC
jgi:hypothetical protein